MVLLLEDMNQAFLNSLFFPCFLRSSSCFVLFLKLILGQSSDFTLWFIRVGARGVNALYSLRGPVELSSCSTEFLVGEGLDSDSFLASRGRKSMEKTYLELLTQPFLPLT